MNAQNLIARYRKHPERIIRAQVVFGGKRKFRQIVERPEIAGTDAGFVKCFLVVRDVAVSVVERPFQALQLECRDLIARGRFDRIETFACRHQIDAFEL
jgi:hypothetical protein